MKTNYAYVFGLSINVAIGFMVLGIGFSYYNALTRTLHGSYKYYDKYVIDNEDLFNSIISGIIPLSAIFGSIIISPLTYKGRRLSIIVIAIATIIGTIFTLIFDMSCLIIGRIIIGGCIGAYVTVCPLYTSEIAPPQISGTIGGLNQLGAVAGVTTGLLMGFIIPLEEDSDALTSKNWRIVFLWPGIVAVIQLVLTLLVFRYDTPKFYKLKGDTKNYEASLRKIYTLTEEELKEFSNNVEDPKLAINEQPAEKIAPNEVENPEDLDNSQRKIVENENIEENIVTTHRPNEITVKPKSTKMAPHYKKALIYGIIYSTLHQTTGVNAITFFSNDLFTDGKDGNSAERKARIGSMLIGVFYIVGIFISLVTLKYYPRLKLSNIWHIVMMIWCAAMGIFSLADLQIGIIAAVLIFGLGFNAGIGGIMWLYTAETLDGKGCAWVGLINMIWTFIFGGFTNFMVLAFTAPGFYFGLTVIQGFAIAYIWIFFKETKGLTKEQCETLYLKKETEAIQ